jgi:hypothetical protein
VDVIIQNLASPEPADQSMEPSRDHESAIGMGQCNGKQATDAQEEEVVEQNKKHRSELVFSGGVGRVAKPVTPTRNPS